MIDGPRRQDALFGRVPEYLQFGVSNSSTPMNPSAYLLGLIRAPFARI